MKCSVMMKICRRVSSRSKIRKRCSLFSSFLAHSFFALLLHRQRWQFMPPHTLVQESFWSFAKVKYVPATNEQQQLSSSQSAAAAGAGAGAGAAAIAGPGPKPAGPNLLDFAKQPLAASSSKPSTAAAAEAAP